MDVIGVYDPANNINTKDNNNTQDINIVDTFDPSGKTYISQGESPNILNKVVENIRKFLGIDKESQYDFYRRLAVEKAGYLGVSDEQVRKQAEQFGQVQQIDINHTLSKFWNSLTFGIVPETEAIKPESTLGKIGMYAGDTVADLAGFMLSYWGTAGVLDRAVSLFSKGGNILDKLDLLTQPEIARTIVNQMPLGYMVKTALEEGAKLGSFTLIDKLVDMNEKTNSIYQSIKNLAPDVLSNALFGAGLPIMSDVLKTPIQKAIFSVALGNFTNVVAGGKTDFQSLIDGIRTGDSQQIINALFNTGMNVLFGITGSGVRERYEKEVEPIKTYLNHLDEVKKVVEKNRADINETVVKNSNVFTDDFINKITKEPKEIRKNDNIINVNGVEIDNANDDINNKTRSENKISDEEEYKEYSDNGQSDSSYEDNAEFSLKTRKKFKPGKEMIEYDYDNQRVVDGEEARQYAIKNRIYTVKALLSDNAEMYIASLPYPQNRYTVKQALMNEVAELIDLISMGKLKNGVIPSNWESPIDKKIISKGILTENEYDDFIYEAAKILKEYGYDFMDNANWEPKKSEGNVDALVDASDLPLISDEDYNKLMSLNFYSAKEDLNDYEIGLIKSVGELFKKNKINPKEFLPFSMMGNKQQMITTKYLSLILKGLKDSNVLIDAFHGSGLISNILSLFRDKLPKDFTVVRNELNEYRRKLYDVLTQKDKVEDFKNAVVKNYKEFVDFTRKNAVIKDGVIKNKSEYAKEAKKFLLDKLKEDKDEYNNLAWYYIAQRASFNNKTFDDYKNYGVAVENDNIRRTFNFKKLHDDKYIEQRIKDLTNEIDFLHKTSAWAKTQIRGVDSWNELGKLLKNVNTGKATIIWDSEYVAEEGKTNVHDYAGEVIKHESGKQIKLKQHVNVDDYIEALDKIIPLINEKKAKIIITNTYRTDLASELANRGFIVYKFFREVKNNKKPELIAVNFDKDGNVLELGKGINNTDKLYAGLPINLAIKQATADAKRLYEAATAPINSSASNIFAYLLVNPSMLQYSKDPVLREFGRSIADVFYTTEKRIADLTGEPRSMLEDMTVISQQIKKQNKDVHDLMHKAVVEGDALQKDPKEIFAQYLANKGISLDTHTMNIIDRFFDLHKKFYNDLLKKDIEVVKNKIERLKTPNASRLAEKMEELYNEVGKQYPFYMHRKRKLGNFEIRVIDRDTGKTLHYEQFTDATPYLFGTNRSLVGKLKADKLKEKYKDKNIDISIQAVKKAQPRTTDVLDIIDFLGNVLRDNDLSDEQISKIIDDTIKELKAKGWLSHTIKRQKQTVKGYIEDPLENAYTYLSQITSHWQKDIFTEHMGELQEKTFNNPIAEKMFKNFSEEILRNKDWIDRTVSAVRGLMYVKYLGFSLKNAFVNVVFQSPVITAMHLSTELAEGKAGVGDFAKSQKILAESAKKYLDGSYKNDKTINAVISDLERLGVLNDQKTAYMTAKTSLLSGGWNKFMDAAGIFMSATEKFNRYTSAIAFIEANKGKIDLSTPESKDLWVRKARDFVYLTNGKYGDKELPFVLQGKDNLKRVLRIGQTFQTYVHQMLLGIKKLYNEKQYTTLLLGMGMLALLGGTATLPLYATIKSVYNSATGRDMEEDLKDAVGSKWLWDMLRGGIIGNLPVIGIDVSSSAGLTLPTDELDFSVRTPGDKIMSLVFGVAYQSVKDTFKGVRYFTNGNIYKGMYYGLPLRFVGYPFKALGEYFKGISTNGDVLLIDPTTGKPLKLTKAELVLQAVGFTPERIAEFKNLYYNYLSIRNHYLRQRQSLYQRYRNAVQGGDVKTARKVALEMIDLNKKIMQINQDYGLNLPYATTNNVKTIKEKWDFYNFYYRNVEGGK